MKKTLLVGNFGSGNIGDEMILKAALEKYSESVVMTADPDFTRGFLERPDLDVVPPFPSGFRSLFQWMINSGYRKALKALQGEIQRVIFPGGGLFAIKGKACFIWANQIQWIRKFFPKTEIRLEAQGVDQGLDGLAQKITQKALYGVNSITVRDEASHKAVEALGFKAEVVEDAVLEWLKEKQEVRSKNQEDSPLSVRGDAEGRRDRKVLLLNAVNPIDQKLYSRIKKEYSKYDLKFILMDPDDRKNIPLGFEGEEVILRSYPQVIHTFREADAAAGERLHFLILASQLTGNQKTKLLRAPYSEKVVSFQEDQGLKTFYD